MLVDQPAVSLPPPPFGGGVEKIGAVVSIDSFRGAVSAAMEMSLRRQADKIDVHRVNNTHKQGLQPFADASLDVKTCLCLLSFLPFPSLLPPLFPFTTLLPSSLSLHPTYRTTERDRSRRRAHSKARLNSKKPRIVCFTFQFLPPWMSSSMDPLLPPGYSSSLRIRNADSLSYLGEKRVLEKREVGGGINSFEESLKTKRSCRGMCNYEGLRNYVVAVNVAFSLLF